MLEQLLGAGNGAAVDQIGRQLGLDSAQTTSALEALLPTVAAGFRRSASGSGGLESLIGTIAGGGASAGPLDMLSRLGQASTVTDGNAILGQIFGSKDVSREVAARASAQTGIGPDVLKALLPIVASLVMGAMAKGAAPGGSPLGQAAAPGGGGLLDMLTPMLDADGDGSVMDDLAGMMGKYLGGR
ncbi:MAG: DUF937 domain-containing protein [Acidobacteria bacterium]|nr:DUF937 domain-containing protein [Acidobacteriota bacterium]